MKSVNESCDQFSKHRGLSYLLYSEAPWGSSKHRSKGAQVAGLMLSSGAIVRHLENISQSSAVQCSEVLCILYCKALHSKAQYISL